MMDRSRSTSWAPYMTWAKHHVGTRWDLTGSNLLACTFDDLPGAREALRLDGRNDDGWPPLVDAIAQRFGVARTRVATGPGASGANFLVYAALLRPGDRVLTEWPGYDPQPGAALLLGAEVDTFPRGWDRRFALDPDAVEAALTDRTRVIVLTNLHNPSGVYADAPTLRRIGELAESVGAKVVVDEVYLDAVPGVDRTPAAHLGDAFVSTNSLTKSYGLSGLRIGWILADPHTVERVWRARDVVDGIGSVPSDVLGALAFSHLDALLERARDILGPGFGLLRDFVESRPELDWVEPPGGSVGFPRLKGTDDAAPFLDHAARDFEVSVTPGRLFGEPAHFRVAVAGERETLERGLEALGQALDAWQE
ncbi:MAG: aminotransferase class I/II-fold pyridoxal phosphate-dependent enzyme [Gemmatimonadetes bacterium]|nr:aminotransferase class I/II-fold pyridoxal phosphate-dependent enzyme [Gemmatimonadota bacterium]